MREQDLLEVQNLLPPIHPATTSFLLGTHFSLVLIPIATSAMYSPAVHLNHINFKMSSIIVERMLTKMGGKRTIFKPWLLVKVSQMALGGVG